MPKMLCLCDNVIRYSEIPCRDEYLIISDVAFEKLGEQIAADDIYDQMTHSLKCSVCGRLWIFWEGFGKPPQSFLPEPS